MSYVAILPPNRFSQMSIQNWTFNPLLVFAVLFLTVRLFCVPAEAHPHVWVDMKTEVIFDQNGLINGLGLYWAFDEAYTQTAVQGLDTNKDGKYSDTELAPLAKANLESIATYHYFTVAEFDNQILEFGDVDASAAKQLYSNGRLALHFSLPFKNPVDPRLGNFAVRIFDPEYYIAFNYVDGDPIIVTGRPPKNCAPGLKSQPTDNDLSQKREYLASKDKEWKPSPIEEFGAIFAQPLVISCPLP